jgi:hypothetical protein
MHIRGYLEESEMDVHLIRSTFSPLHLASRKIFVSLILAITTVFIAGCIGSKTTEKEAYKVETNFLERGGYITLAVTPFGLVKDDCTLVIIDENGDAAGTTCLLKEHFVRGEIIQGETTREIKMTGLPYRTPTGNRFFLLIKKEGQPEPILRKELEFAGAKLSVVSLKGSRYWQAQETKNRTIEKLCVNLQNSGDMPVWITDMELEIANNTVSTKLKKPVIMMPNKKETLEFTDIYVGLPYGEQPLAITFYDDAETIVGVFRTSWDIVRPTVGPGVTLPCTLPCTLF